MATGMTTPTRSPFKAQLLRPASTEGGGKPWAFVVLPKAVSAKLPRRGRTSVDGRLNGHPFTVMLEPDGQKSHWLKLDQALLKAAGVDFGDVAELEVSAVAQEPEPETPADLAKALRASPAAQATWQATTTLARVDWIHWITSAKQTATRANRIQDGCDMLASGKKRVCCFDPSGVYNKAFAAPQSAD